MKKNENLPKCKIDFRKHPYYVGHHMYHQWTTRILDCEVLSISFSTGGCRVRIINPDTGEYYSKNCDTSTIYLVGLDLSNFK